MRRCPEPRAKPKSRKVLRLSVSQTSCPILVGVLFCTRRTAAHGVHLSKHVCRQSCGTPCVAFARLCYEHFGIQGTEANTKRWCGVCKKFHTLWHGSAQECMSLKMSL